MDLILRIINIILPVLMISMIGYAYGRIKKPDTQPINRLLMDILYPFLVFSAMTSRDFKILDYSNVILCFTIVMVGSGLIAWGVARVLNYNRYAFIPPMVFTNVGNMGLPLALLAFGPEIMSAAVAMFVVASFLHVTFGIRLCSPNADVRGILRGPILWAMVLGILMNLMGITLPPFMETSFKLLGGAAVPLGLFALGIGFSACRVNRWSIGLLGGVLCPISGLLVLWPLLSLFEFSPTIRGLVILYSALPPAIMNYIFAQQYQQDPAGVSAIVVCGSIISLFVMPMVLYWAL